MRIREINSSKNNKIVKVFKALGDDNRFQIITLLLENNLCVGALARILNISKPAVSQHLKILRKAGLVRGEKIGYWTHYKVEKELLRESVRHLQELIELQSVVLSKDNYMCFREKLNNMDTERRVLEMCKNRCEQPDKLKTISQECSPEQIRECHGDDKDHACVSSCEQPEKLQTKPSECTPEQIKECHGDSKKHPC